MSFMPDGKRLAFWEYTPKGQIWTVPLEDQGAQLKAGTPEPFLESNSSDSLPSFSPDGRWLAYTSDESGKSEVYVREFRPASSAQGPKVQISNSGDTFVPEKPRVWIAKFGGIDWDLSPDRKRVVVLTPLESAGAPARDHEVVFLLNFFDELRRRVPAKQ